MGSCEGVAVGVADGVLETDGDGSDPGWALEAATAKNSPPATTTVAPAPNKADLICMPEV